MSKSYGHTSRSETPVYQLFCLCCLRILAAFEYSVTMSPSACGSCLSVAEEASDTPALKRFILPGPSYVHRTYSDEMKAFIRYCRKYILIPEPGIVRCKPVDCRSQELAYLQVKANQFVLSEGHRRRRIAHYCQMFCRSESHHSRSDRSTDKLAAGRTFIEIPMRLERRRTLHFQLQIYSLC
jgi:hypothetical protein